MGQAKRRKIAGTYPRAETEEYEFYDADVGYTYQVRDTGITPRQWVDQTIQVQKDERASNDVACKSCTQCCYWPRVDVDPEQEEPEHLRHLTIIQGAKGWYIPKRADGGCIHLGPKGCTVYEHRPRACRKFDCRIFGLIDAAAPIGNNHYGPVWRFRYETDADTIIRIAARMGMMPVITDMLNGGVSPNFETVSKAIATGIAHCMPEARQVFEDIERLPKAELDKLKKLAEKGDEEVRRASLRARY